jgi:uncharacterized protein (TIGR00255 family)
MIRSMTGFGRSDAAAGEGGYLVELRSTNHRFAEVVCRLPRELVALEARVKQAVKERLQRGRVEVFVGRTGATKQGTLVIDTAGLRGALDALRAAKEVLQLEGDVNLTQLLTFRELFSFQSAALEEAAAWTEIGATLQVALERWDAARRREGEALVADVRQRLATMGELLQGVEADSAGVAAEVAERLRGRLAELLAGSGVDPARFEQEVGLLATRADVTEEIVRLRSHLQQFANALDEGDAPGRRLDFLLQEMLREVNTIGSKTTQVAVTNRVVRLKETVEQIREQVQNVE